MIDLTGKRGLIAGVANEHSIAYGCAKTLKKSGAEIACTYGNAKAKPFVKAPLNDIGIEHLYQCDVTEEEQLIATFDGLQQKWGTLDFLIHAIAFAPKDALHSPVADCPRQGFLTAMEISCYSFIRMSQLARPLMKDGGSLITLSYYGSQKVVAHYNIMGPVKAALESVTTYMAADLGKDKIRVNAISPGPIMTRAGAGIDHFDTLLTKSQDKSPLKQLTTLEDVGNMAAFLVSDAANNITGGVHYVDGGYGIMD